MRFGFPLVKSTDFNHKSNIKQIQYTLDFFSHRCALRKISNRIHIDWFSIGKKMFKERGKQNSDKKICTYFNIDSIQLLGTNKKYTKCTKYSGTLSDTKAVIFRIFFIFHLDKRVSFALDNLNSTKCQKALSDSLFGFICDSLVPVILCCFRQLKDWDKHNSHHKAQYI